MRIFPIRNLKPVVTSVDSTEIGNACTKAQNVMFRPRGAIKGAPLLRKLWGFGTTTTPFATFGALTHPTGVGTITAADKTICVRIYLQGKNFIMFFNMYTGSTTENGVVYTETPGERGTFYIGDDGSSALDFNPTAAGPPLFEVLAVGLAAHARWYGTFSFGQLMAQNGVDDSVAIQLGRTYTPGKYRKRASNAVLNAAVITAIEPEKALNTQATRVVTGRAGGVNLVFTASQDNYPGIYGNSKIKVRIVYAGAYSVGPITSSMTGDGTTGSPFIYTLTTTEQTSSNTAIISFVESDSRAIPILSASGANATADTMTEVSSTFLTGGAGTGASEGLSNEVTDVYIRLWDGGHANLGYEAPSSPVSNELVLDGVTFKDILVTVDIDSTLESGRFSHANAGIRVYKRTATLPDVIYSLMNEDAVLKNTARSQRVIGTDATTPMWVWASQVTATFVALTDVCTFSTPLTNGQVLMSLVTSEGITALAKLWVIDASGSTGKLSLTSGGAAIDLGSSYTATVADHTNDQLEVTGTLVNNQTLQIPATLLGIPGTTTLHVIDASTTLGVTTFKVSLTSGGAAVNVTGNGSVTIHVNGSLTLQLGTTYPDRLWSIETATAASPSTTDETANTITFPAAVANGNVFVLEAATAGLPAQTKLFAINASGSTCQLALVAAGTALDITTTGSANIYRLTAHEWATTDIFHLPSGGGAVAPSSLALNTRYFIKALEADGFGITLSTGRNGDAAALGSNGSTLTVTIVAVSMVIGSATEPGRAMSPDQHRPPPHRYITMAGTFNWIAGLSLRETDMLSSKDAQFDEQSPEGVDLEDVDTINKSRVTSDTKPTGLWSDKMRLTVHFADGVVIINPNDTTDQQEPLLDAGMVNGACSSTDASNQIIFLAADRQLKSLNGTRYGNRASSNKSDDAMGYINTYVDVDEMIRSPESCCFLHDRESGMVWMWFPTSAGNNIGFAYDEQLDGIVGPFTAPCEITSAAKMEGGRGQYVVANKDGYLFSWSTFAQNDEGDLFNTAAPTLNAVGATVPAAHVGYDVNTVSAYNAAGTLVSGDLFYSQRSILESGFIDLGDSGKMKNFIGLQWRAVAGSRGYIRVSFINMAGAERSVWYGELGNKQRNRPHRVLINMVDSAIKFRFEVFSADFLPYIVRDFELLVAD